jgi:hypothetical protein
MSWDGQALVNDLAIILSGELTNLGLSTGGLRMHSQELSTAVGLDVYWSPWL